MIALYRIVVEPVRTEDGAWLRDAIMAFGRGRGAAPAALNFGDLFAYALARRLELPLTDVESAILHRREPS